MKCFHCDGDTIKTEHEDFDEIFNEKYTISAKYHNLNLIKAKS